MKKREDETSLVNGELWESFKKTLYYDELNKFITEKREELRDMIIIASMDGKHEDARDLGQKLSGFLLISNFIEDSVNTRVEALQFEKEQKTFEKQLPHRL
jgi:hypothetical protein